MPSQQFQAVLEAAGPSRGGVLEAWVALPDDLALVGHLRLVPGQKLPDHDAVIADLVLAVAAIDRLLSRQVDAILHHPMFQALEARWRGLRRLTEQVDHKEGRCKVRVLDVSWKELVRDLGKAIEFDQSALFRKVYSEEFGVAGGEPYAVLVADYEVRHRRSSEHPDDVGALRALSEVAAASFAPIILSAHASLFGLDAFHELERPLDLEANFRSVEFNAWNSMRKHSDTRFLGLTLPRMLMRLPYRCGSLRADGWVYDEDVSAADGRGHLFGSASWAFAEVLIRTFSENGWLAGIRGVERDAETGGILTGLVTDWFGTDARGRIPKGAVEVQITGEQERELGELGFIALTHCPGTPFAAFYGNQSLHDYGRAVTPHSGVTVEHVNAKLSSMLQYMFCVSRFAHYVKVIARDKVGSYTRAEDIEAVLHDWLNDYATSNESASPEDQARYPLREARVEVREVPGRPGVYQTEIHLRPHYQLDQMSSSVKLVTELFAGRAP